MTYHIEQSGDVYFLVNNADPTDRLEAGHSLGLAKFALTTLNSGVAEVDPSRNLNPYPNGRYTAKPSVHDCCGHWPNHSSSCNYATGN